MKARSILLVATLFACSCGGKDGSGDASGGDYTGGPMPVDDSELAALSCGHVAPFEITLTYEITSVVTGLGTTLNYDAQSWISMAADGTVEYADTYTIVDETVHRYKNTATGEDHTHNSSNGCLPIPGTTIGSDGLNAIGGWFAWRQQPFTKAGSEEYHGFQCDIVSADDPPFERCFSTEHCADVRQNGEAAGVLVDLQLKDVAYSFDASAFDNPCRE